MGYTVKPTNTTAGHAKRLAALVTFTLLVVAGFSQFASAHGRASAPKVCENGAITDYYGLYSSIASTRVFVIGERLLTADGKLINVPITPQLIDLRQLVGLFKGIPVPLASMSLPGGVSSIDVVEIQLKLRNSPDAEIKFDDQTSCDLKHLQHGVLALTTPTPIRLNAGTNYRVEVDYEDFDAIQFNCGNPNSGSGFKPDHGQCSKHGCHIGNGHNHKLKCELACRRLPIIRAKSANDEV